MVSREVPVLVARACEMFITELTMRAFCHADSNGVRTLKVSLFYVLLSFLLFVLFFYLFFVFLFLFKFKNSKVIFIMQFVKMKIDLIF